VQFVELWFVDVGGVVPSTDDVGCSDDQRDNLGNLGLDRRKHVDPWLQRCECADDRRGHWHRSRFRHAPVVR
jgi:hypothetical protein